MRLAPKSLLLVVLPMLALATELSWNPFDLSKHPEALCNDGTPSGYYWKEAPKDAAPLWIVFLESGGWCYDQTSCGKRSVDQTSSKKYPTLIDLQGIFNSTDRCVALSAGER